MSEKIFFQVYVCFYRYTGSRDAYAVTTLESTRSVYRGTALGEHSLKYKYYPIVFVALVVKQQASLPRELMSQKNIII